MEPAIYGERPEIPQRPEGIPLGYPKEDYHTVLRADTVEVDEPMSASSIRIGDLKERAIREWWARKGHPIPPGAPVPPPPEGTTIAYGFSTLSHVVETPIGRTRVGELPSDLPDEAQITFKTKEKYGRKVISREYNGDTNEAEFWIDLVALQWENTDGRNVTVKYTWKFFTDRTILPFTEERIARGHTSRYYRDPPAEMGTGSLSSLPRRDWNEAEMGWAPTVYDLLHFVDVYKGEESPFWKRSDSATKKEITDYLIDRALEDNRWRPKGDGGDSGPRPDRKPPRRSPLKVPEDGRP